MITCANCLHRHPFIEITPGEKCIICGKKLRQFCQAVTRYGAQSGSWAGTTWKCARLASIKPEHDHAYCWQHQDPARRG